MASLTEKFDKLVGTARDLGIPAFLLGSKNGAVVSIHFDAMPMSDAMTIMINGFHQVIAMNLEKNTGYSAGRRQIYVDLAKDFDALLKRTNELLAAEEQANGR